MHIYHMYIDIYSHTSIHTHKDMDAYIYIHRHIQT